MEDEFGPGYLEWLGNNLDTRRKGDEPFYQPSNGEIWQPTERDHFITKFLKIRTKTAGRACFELNRAQREYSATCSKQNVVLKARQIGITTYIAARFFAQTISQSGILSMQVTHDRQSAEDVFRIVRRFWDNLPEEWRKGNLRTSHRNVRQLVFPHLDSEYCLASAAENAGRGRTIQNLHCSEVSRWGGDGDEALASLRAAVVPDGQMVLESTPNGAGGLFYEEWQRAAETGYTRHFFPWWYDAAYAIEPGSNFGELTEEEQELARLHGLKLDQIAWRRKQWASFRGLAAQEFAEDAASCFLASGECFFELAAVERALKQMGEPLTTHDNGRASTWLPARTGKSFVIGVDPAGGGAEGDYSCAEVIDFELGAQCAELHGHWTPRELADKVVELGKQYNTALLAVERNNHGHTVLARIRTLDYPRVFQQDEKDGWLTTAANRPTMLENLASVLSAEPERFRSERLLHEFRTFVRDADGRPAAASGAHDDCVIAMAIAWAVRMAEAGQRAKNWTDFSSLEK